MIVRVTPGEVFRVRLEIVVVYALFSKKYDSSAVDRLRRSVLSDAAFALPFVFANFGIAIAARIPMITTTISSSMRVKPRRGVLRRLTHAACAVSIVTEITLTLLLREPLIVPAITRWQSRGRCDSHSQTYVLYRVSRQGGATSDHSWTLVSHEDDADCNVSGHQPYALASSQLSPIPKSTISGTFKLTAEVISRSTSSFSAAISSGGASNTSSSCTWRSIRAWSSCCSI